MSLNFPATHAVHGPPSGPVWPLSHLQSVCAALDGSDSVFDGHRRHSVVFVLEYVLALQELQTSVVAAVAVETLPAGHWVQDAGPMLALNLPATQGSHASPSGPVCPLLQVQLDSAMLADADPEFAGHARHTVLLVLEYVLTLQRSQTSVVDAVDEETLPAGHCMHRAAPTLSLNFPATHAVHGPPSGPV